MRMRSFFPSLLAAVWASPIAHALMLDGIRARIEAAGYSQIREVPTGKIRTFKAFRWQGAVHHRG